MPERKHNPTNMLSTRPPAEPNSCEIFNIPLPSVLWNLPWDWFWNSIRSFDALQLSRSNVMTPLAQRIWREISLRTSAEWWGWRCQTCMKDAMTGDKITKSRETPIAKSCPFSRTKNQPKEEVFGTDIPRTSGGHSRGYPGQELRSGRSKSWKNKHFGADIHDPKVRTSTTLRDFQKLRSEKLWAELSFSTFAGCGSGLWLGSKHTAWQNKGCQPETVPVYVCMLWSYYLVQVWPSQVLLSGPSRCYYLVQVYFWLICIVVSSDFCTLN